MPVLDGGHLGGRRQQIVDKRCGQRISVVVVDQVLQQGAADALHRATGDLALDDVGVDHRADVLADDVAGQRDAAGDGVHLARAGVGGVGPVDRCLRGEPGGRLQGGRHPGR